MEVTVIPSSSCYFAGEDVKFDIVFTNSNTPSAIPRSHSHRRGHSISSAPLARPPTSPGVFGHKMTPISPVTGTSTAPGSSPLRQGIIGSPTTTQTFPTSHSKRLPQSKSLSSSISKSEIVQLVLGNNAAPSSSRAINPFPTHHPHARKQSVQWNMAESAPSTANTQTSYSLQLAPIDEAHSPGLPPTPALPSPMSMSMPHAPPGRPHSAVNPPSRGLGIDFQTSSRVGERGGPRSASSGTLPIQGTETLLWAYAQVRGSVELDTRTVDHANLASMRSRLSRSGPIGAGRMDLHDRTRDSGRSTEGGWSSLLGLTSPRFTSPSTPSFLSNLFSTRPTPPNIGLDANTEAISTFVPSQTMLAVDLTLGPGESKTYTYSIRLPKVLPPTYRGRTFRISYNLVIGTCRGRLAATDAQSRLLRVPIRVYNAVSIREPRVRYDLLWPLTPLGGSQILATVQESRPTYSKISKKDVFYAKTAAELVTFGTELVLGESRGKNDSNYEEEDLDVVTVEGDSRLSVEVLTRQVRTASFDVHKGGISVASLLLPKTTLRLGETVQGIVLFNNRPLDGVRVLKLGCFLETHERLPDKLASPSNRFGSRRVQSEQHSNMVLHLQRTYFSLNIPSDASPGFSIHIGDEDGEGGLEWRVRICFLVCDGKTSLESVGPEGEWGNSSSAGDGSGLGNLETVECEIPLSVLPAHTVFGSMPVSFPV